MSTVSEPRRRGPSGPDSFRRVLEGDPTVTLHELRAFVAEARRGIVGTPSPEEFHRLLTRRVGQELAEEITAEERQFLVERGQHRVEAEWAEFRRRRDWLEASKERHHAGEYYRRQAASLQSQEYYGLGHALQDLPPQDRGLLLRRRLVLAQEAHAFRIEDGFIRAHTRRGPIERLEDLLPPLEEGFWQALRLPAVEEVLAHVEDPEALFQEYLLDRLLTLREAHLSRATDLEGVSRSRRISDLGALRTLILALINQSGLTPRPPHPEDYLHQLSEEVYDRLVGQWELSGSARVRWNDCSPRVRDHLTESTRLRREELGRFQGDVKGLEWKSLSPPFQDELLRALGQDEVAGFLLRRERLVRLAALLREPGRVDTASELNLLLECFVKGVDLRTLPLDPEEWTPRHLAGVPSPFIPEPPWLLDVFQRKEPVSPKAKQRCLERLVASRIARLFRAWLRGESASATPLEAKIDQLLEVHKLISLPKVEALLAPLREKIILEKVVPLATLRPLLDILEAQWDAFTTIRLRHHRFIRPGPDGKGETLSRPSLLVSRLKPDQKEQLNRYLAGDPQVRGSWPEAREVLHLALSEIGRYVAFHLLREPQALPGAAVKALTTAYDLSGVDPQALAAFVEEQKGHPDRLSRERFMTVLYVLAHDLTARSIQLRHVEEELREQSIQLEAPALEERKRRLAARREQELDKIKREVYRSIPHFLPSDIEAARLKFLDTLFRGHLERLLPQSGAGEREGIDPVFPAYCIWRERVPPREMDLSRFLKAHAGKTFQKVMGELDMSVSAIQAEAAALLKEEVARRVLRVPHESVQVAGRDIASLAVPPPEKTSPCLQIRTEPGMAAVPMLEFSLDGLEVEERIMPHPFISVEHRVHGGKEEILVLKDPTIQRSLDSLGLTQAQLKNLTHELKLLLRGQDLYGVKRVVLWQGSPHAGHLDREGVLHLSLAGLDHWRVAEDLVGDHIRTHGILRTIRESLLREGFPAVDSRIPQEFWDLAEEYSAIRHTLERIKILQSYRGGLDPELVSHLSGQLDPEGETLALIRWYVARDDWAEEEVFCRVMEEFLPAVPVLYGALLPDLRALLAIKQENRPRYETILRGMIAEALGADGRLPRERLLLSRIGHDDPEEIWLQVIQAIGRLAAQQFSAEETRDLAHLSSPAIWDELESHYRSGLNAVLVGRSGERFDLRLVEEKQIASTLNYELASLHLLGSLSIPSIPHHRHFVRHLLEEPRVYRRLIAPFYESETEQLRVLRRIIQEYNAHPRHRNFPVHYPAPLLETVRKTIYLRPDLVRILVRRELRKEVYKALPESLTVKGKREPLRVKNALPNLLHRVQEVFGSVTPAVHRRLGEELGLEGEEISRNIAFYKKYTADRTGEMRVEVCTGDACWQKRSPLILEELGGCLGVKPEEVAANGVQYSEESCFGVCHLAPVVRIGDRLLGHVTPEGIPLLLDGATAVKHYEDRVEYFRELRRSLRPGVPIQFCRGARVVQHVGLEGELTGSMVGIDEAGRLWVTSGVPAEPHHSWGPTPPESREGRVVGRFVERTLSFDHEGGGGVGTLILDEADRVVGVLNCPDRGLQRQVASAVKPKAAVKGGLVYLAGTRRPLGPLNTVTLGVLTPQGYGALTLDGESRSEPPPPEGDDGRGIELQEDEEYLREQDRVLLALAGKVSPPWDIERYETLGGYGAIRKVLGLDAEGRRVAEPWTPEEIFHELAISKLRGRGGAFFPTAVKWEAVRRAEVRHRGDELGEIRFVVANGDEGDTGVFMDRSAIAELPHLTLEGMLIAAIAVGARQGYYYVRYEYRDAVRSVERAIHAARRKGYLGRNIFGVPGLDFDVEPILGAGAFIAGEKRGILASIEGNPAEPKLSLRLEAREGLWGKPTLLNNVKTLGLVPTIITRGGVWFRELGHGETGGTLAFSVSGIVRKTGRVEISPRRTLREIIRISGGIEEGYELTGVRVGGPSGKFLKLTGESAYLLDEPVVPETFTRRGAVIGSAGLVFLGKKTDMLEFSHHTTQWLEGESCGQCRACMFGSGRMASLLARLMRGEATAQDLWALKTLSDEIKANSECGLGQTIPNGVLSAMDHFGEWYLHGLLRNLSLSRLELLEGLWALGLAEAERGFRVGGTWSREGEVEARLLGFFQQRDSSALRTLLEGIAEVRIGFTLEGVRLARILRELQAIDRDLKPTDRQAPRFQTLLSLPGPDSLEGMGALEWQEPLPAHRMAELKEWLGKVYVVEKA